MTGSYTPERIQEEFEVPSHIMPFILAHPRLLPGETKDSFFALMDMMVCTILPEDDIEWLATIDLGWLNFEIQRYRRWKSIVIAISRGDALFTALSATHPAAAINGAIVMVATESRTQAQE